LTAGSRQYAVRGIACCLLALTGLYSIKINLGGHEVARGYTGINQQECNRKGDAKQAQEKQ
jgi:hypothetical protein